MATCRCSVPPWILRSEPAMKLICKLRQLLLLASLCWPALGYAEVVVVMSAKAGVEKLTQEQVINIFLGRYRKLDSGQGALPIDQPGESELRAEFYRKLVGKNISEINTYWTQLILSGKTTPPLATQSPEKVLEVLSTVPGAIGYIDPKQVDARVRVVFRFKD